MNKYRIGMVEAGLSYIINVVLLEDIMSTDKNKLCTVAFLMRETGMAESEVMEALEDKRFRKSVILSSEGKPCYRLNTPFSWFVDIWEGFRHLSAMKY